MNKEAFCQTLGIESEEVEFISIPSPFPVENRPILHVPMGRMTSKEIDNTLPTLAKAVQKILEQHSQEKGIIHICMNSSYSI